MRIRLLTLAAFFIILTFVNPAPAFAPDEAINALEAEIFRDITRDFQLFTALLQEVNYEQEFIVVRHARSQAEAIAWLSPGFEPALARVMVEFYLQPDPEFDRLLVIPTDSIPVITPADQEFCQITVHGQTAVLERKYVDCYNPGDQFLYQVTAKKSDHWKITDIKLTQIPSTRFPFNS